MTLSLMCSYNIYSPVLTHVHTIKEPCPTLPALIIEQYTCSSHRLTKTANSVADFLSLSLLTNTHPHTDCRNYRHKLTRWGHEITWMNQVHLLTQTQCVYSLLSSLHLRRVAGKSSVGQFWLRFKPHRRHHHHHAELNRQQNSSLHGCPHVFRHTKEHTQECMRMTHVKAH